MNRALHAALVLGLPILLTAINVRLMASGGYISVAYSRPGFPPPVGMSDGERRELARVSTRFILDRSDAATLLALRQAGRPLYQVGEVDHLLDVRRLVTWLSVAGLAAGALLTAAAASWWRGGDRLSLGSALRRGAWLNLALVAFLGAGVAVAWRTAFTLFHEILFPPGTWQFSADSGLIRLFPETFWSDAAMVLLGATIAESVALLVVGRWIERHPRAH